MPRTKLPAKTNSEFPLSDDPLFLALPFKRQRFVYNIFLQPVTGWSNTKCYKKAYNISNPNSAGVEAHKLLKDPKVKTCVDRIKQAYQQKMGFTAERILTELGAISYSDVGKYIDKNGLLIVNPKKLPEQVRRAISGFEAVRQLDGSTKYKIRLWNKTEGLKQMISVLGVSAPSKHEFSGPGGKPIEHKVSHDIDLSGLSDEELNVLIKLINRKEKPMNDT